MRFRSLSVLVPVLLGLSCSDGTEFDPLATFGTPDASATGGAGGVLGGAGGTVGVGGGAQTGGGGSAGGSTPMGGGGTSTGGSTPTGGGGTSTGGSTPTGGGGTSTGGSTPTGGGGTSTGGSTPTGGGGTSTGGSTPTGGGGGIGGTTPVDTKEYTVDDGGFVTVCDWTGYAWTRTDGTSSISPTGFDSVSAGTKLCASGTVQARDDWSGYAMLGINVGQAEGDDTDAIDVATDGDGLYVDLDNRGGSELRVQIQTSQAEDDENARWCAVYSGPGVIRWSDFNTKCWDGSGSAYAGQNINAVLVMAPGHNTDARNFDFCINRVEPSGGSCGSSPGTGGSNPGTGGSNPGTGGSNPGTGGSNPGTGGSGQTLPDLQGGENGFATRYWDCCKPSCGWTANASNPVDSCDINDRNIGVNDGDRNGCEGGTAFTCHSWAPWALSDKLSYGFAAFNGAQCGTCYQVRFSGSSSRGTPTPGIDGKQMVVQVTNIGGIEGNQFDILIPGGGVGAMNGCSTQWGSSDLGVQYGGFRSTCGANAGCIRNMCQNAFGDSPELMAGCDWYIDWLQMADNPDIRYAPIECPAEIRAVSGG